jgi:hypothetical protein
VVGADQEVNMLTIRQLCDKAEEDATRLGFSDGRSAGSWVIDGNTSLETCREWVRKIDECDFDGPDAPNDEQVAEEHPDEFDDAPTEVWYEYYAAAWREGWESAVYEAAKYQTDNS